MLKILNKEKWNLLQLFVLKTLGAMFGFLFLKFILIKFGAADVLVFSEYRRYTSFAIIILFLGYHVTLPIENLKKNSNENQIIIPILFAIVSSTIFYLFNPSIKYFAMHLISFVFIASIFTIDRANGNLIKGSQLQFILSSIFPFISAAISNDISSYIESYFFIVILFMLFKLKKIKFNRFKINIPLLKRSIGRIFQDLMNVSIPFLIVFIAKDEGTSYRAFIMTLIMGLYLIKSPFNLLIADLMAKKRIVNESINYFFISIILILILTAAYKLLLTPINIFYFNNYIFFNELNKSVYFIPPYFLYMSLRNYLDVYIQNVLTNIFTFLTILLFLILIYYDVNNYISGALSYMIMNIYILYLMFNFKVKF